MDKIQMAFTAVFLRAPQGYVGFVEEIPTVTTQGKTIEEARDNLRRHAALVFREERALAEEMLAGKEVVRESFLLPLRDD